MNQEIYQEILDKALNETQKVRESKEGWNFIKKGKYLTLSNTQYKDLNYKMVKLEGIIPVNYEKAAEFYFHDNQAQKKVRNNIEEITKIEEISEETYIILVKLKAKLVIVSAREVIGVQSIKRLNQNEIVIYRANLNEHPKVPFKKNVIRCEGKIYGIFLTKVDENQTKFEAYLILDPKGNIPAFVVNFVTESLLSEFENDIINIIKQK
ncbi:START domain protein (macronuclear) [Tetrahymena thermophila SB210]|uniref:START domain protein n=1 Tax=Tetrahymena thermophila (strain SB210) TaxID=312017 RepID=Q22DP1_TETTS|nr:START domain protein [Tetrahymena thermophila SB210]EAR83413.1 START domain protein [Tetrahymena thermophila SB210]|eukprot:XP_001031076.1 START domain protein [Tetrahymena thermophila SB210]